MLGLLLDELGLGHVAAGDVGLALLVVRQLILRRQRDFLKPSHPLTGELPLFLLPIHVFVEDFLHLFNLIALLPEDVLLGSDEADF